ncbi:substrate-binding domain-containing protein [Cellulomonas triticagri]|uniref:substrate-binding domain-containing protein n=1 Tax=Cellulomonas triticagri TaxID=2483352 RepID=UPI0013153CA8|nr:substrate-binding domain-containing protein [Cellulomonas triticagri]
MTIAARAPSLSAFHQFGPSEVVLGASAAAREAGYVLDIVTLDMESTESIAGALDLLRQHDLAGVIALSSTDEMTHAFEEAQFNVPVVLSTEPDDTVQGRSELSAVGFPALIAHLADLGHRTFLHLAGPPTWSAARNRTRAFQAAVEARGLRSEGVLHGDWSARSGYAAVREIGGAGFAATAVVAANDQMALGAMLALRELGLDVPGDVSVTGVDDIPEAAYFCPPLTMLRFNFAEQGRSAVAALLGQIEEAGSAERAAARPELVIRRSTAQART